MKTADECAAGMRAAGLRKMTRRLRPGLLPLGLVLLLGTGCDRSVTNPGPIQDEFLDDAQAHPALVNGMTRALSVALNHIAYTGGAVSREIVASGNQTLSAFGITRQQRDGILAPGTEETNEHWNLAQQARWLAEDGVRRMRVTLGDAFASSALASKALLYAGYANRLLGENMCEAVVDGGGSEPRRVFHERAEDAFSEALEIAGRAGQTDVDLAARAGRASVRVWLADWPGAVEDAEGVPLEFTFQAAYSSVELDQYNRVYWSTANQPYRNHTVWSTFYEGYFLESGDPRTPWASNPQHPTGILGVPWLFQTKYADRDSPITLSSGREARLIVAEGRLRQGDAPGALAIVNQLRARAGVEPRNGTTLEEVWTALKRERGIELWLEGRRLGDLHRWLAEGVPGEVEDLTGSSTCFPIGVIERNANPNLNLR